MKFRKKPVIIEAEQWDGWYSCSIALFMGCDVKHKNGTIYIQTLEGEMKASKGDWIIKGIKGEFYPCKPDIFAETYEPVDEHAL